MPLVYQQNINATTKLGVWEITETEAFFLKKVAVQREIAHPHKRLQHLAGRYLLKMLYPDFPVELIMIADTRKPFLPEEEYHFSISHCRNYAAVIISKDHRVGVDIEMINEKIERIIHKFLSAQEQEMLKNDSVNRVATLLWSVKESIFKWFGNGEVDFKKHMHIKRIEATGNRIAEVDFLKNNTLRLEVNFLPFEDHFLSWIVTEIK